MRILIAPNAFKNSISAADAAIAMRQGLEASSLKCQCECFPVADGGDGTASLIINKFKGSFLQQLVNGPLGRKIMASYGLIDNGCTAVIEMAEASGIKLIQKNEPDPLHALSSGTGELIRHALDKGVRKILLGVGGSATVDGGCGILLALGIRFLDASGKDLLGLPESLIHLDQIDISGLDKRISETELTILCDVENKLLGENGAVQIFGPQKGASRSDLIKLEQALTKMRDICFLQTGKDMNKILHGGAAGGAAAGMHIFLNACLVSGVEYYLDITGFNASLEKSDLVITGEGSIDLQTLEGKGPFGVAKRAKNKNIPVIGLAGKIPLVTEPALMQYFDVLLAIGHQPENINNAFANTEANLINTTKQIGNLINSFHH